MQFSTVTLIAAATAALVNADILTTTTKVETLVTITDCGPTVSDCPASHVEEEHSTSIIESPVEAPANVSTFEGAASKQFAVGAVALAAGALLAL
ncbi:hypothetical protein KGF56_003061 [Candida oxycetoniae]|uniref:Uncharacterized protein n=1 Tax=Candida oxycetoniae TaxID=497107 RepID=A0AAI9SWS6_9ASCO|nr:uncharacterized protein KGF56_003061 [Candida oxycetoniae]KAI3404161.1 hypothetical protein KGF56_003061 [Candida oxycetoniae]